MLKRIQIRSGSVLLLTTTIYFLCCRSLSPEPKCRGDKDFFRIDFVSKGDEGWLYSNSRHIMDASGTLAFDETQVQCDAKSPLQFSVTNIHQLIAHLKNRSSGKPLKDVWYRYSWQFGVTGAKPDLNFKYALPYRNGDRHRVSQGYFGATHTVDTGQQYAVDFSMPIKTLVCAARSGVVVGLKAEGDGSGRDISYEACSNYVLIKHTDGTYAEYAHLQHNGILVQLGQNVEEGKPIAYSGNTGFSTGPHLHFMLFFINDLTKRESIPPIFMTDEGAVGKLVVGRDYLKLYPAD